MLCIAHVLNHMHLHLLGHPYEQKADELLRVPFGQRQTSHSHRETSAVHAQETVRVAVACLTEQAQQAQSR